MQKKILSLLGLPLFLIAAAGCPQTSAPATRESSPVTRDAVATPPTSPTSVTAVPSSTPSDAPGEPAIAGELLEMHRAACYGTCPVYTVTVFDDGRVVYEGTDFVMTKGKAEKTIDAATIAKLRDAFHAVDWFNLGQYAYDSSKDPTDGPSTELYFGENGRGHRVEHYRSSLRAPAGLRDLESKIDALLETEKWIGTAAERSKMNFHR
ncbi:MAG: DUF6438 domain-containing protein [Polyangiaceae bacterium]